MITIKAAPKGKETTLNEIPVGTTFTGCVEGGDGIWTSGLFLKMTSLASFTQFPGMPVADVLVACLTPGLKMDDQKAFYLFYKCARVRNYVEVDITIEVKEKS